MRNLRIHIIIVLLLSTSGCICRPTKFFPADIDIWWDMGYEDVKCYGVKKVSYEKFTFVPNSLSSFRCGRVAETVGCFFPPNTIEYSIKTPYVLRHEATHAILHAAGFSVPEAQRCWATIGHAVGDRCEPCK